MHQALSITAAQFGMITVYALLQMAAALPGGVLLGLFYVMEFSPWFKIIALCLAGMVTITLPLNLHTLYAACATNRKLSVKRAFYLFQGQRTKYYLAILIPTLISWGGMIAVAVGIKIGLYHLDIFVSSKLLTVGATLCAYITSNTSVAVVYRDIILDNSINPERTPTTETIVADQTINY